MNLPPVKTFPSLAGLTQAQVNAEYKAAVAGEARANLSAREAEVTIRAEFRAEVIAWNRANARAYFARQMECYAAFRKAA
jgi:hypothetical protein